MEIDGGGGAAKSHSKLPVKYEWPLIPPNRKRNWQMSYFSEMRKCDIWEFSPGREMRPKVRIIFYLRTVRVYSTKKYTPPML